VPCEFVALWENQSNPKHDTAERTDMEPLAEENQKSTLLPRFSIRTLFWLITASAFLFVVVGMAARGHVWAWGISIGITSILFTALIHAVWFGVASFMSQVLSPRTKDAG
jgi:hypothetical protein